MAVQGAKFRFGEFSPHPLPTRASRGEGVSTPANGGSIEMHLKIGQ